MRSYCIHIALLAICFLTRTDATADSPADLYRSRSQVPVCRKTIWKIDYAGEGSGESLWRMWDYVCAEQTLRRMRTDADVAAYTRVVQRIKMTLRYIFFCSKDAQC